MTDTTELEKCLPSIKQYAPDYVHYFSCDTQEMFELILRNKNQLFSKLDKVLSLYKLNAYHIQSFIDYMIKVNFIDKYIADNFLLSFINYSYLKKLGMRTNRIDSKINEHIRPPKSKKKLLHSQRLLSGYFLWLIEKNGGNHTQAKNFLSVNNVFEIDEREMRNAFYVIRNNNTFHSIIESIEPMLILMIFNQIFNANVDIDRILIELKSESKITENKFHQNFYYPLKNIFNHYVDFYVQNTHKSEQDKILSNKFSQKQIEQIEKGIPLNKSGVHALEITLLGYAWFKVNFLEKSL